MLRREYNFRGIPLAVVKHLTRQTLAALDYLHRTCNIIHTGAGCRCTGCLHACVPWPAHALVLLCAADCHAVLAVWGTAPAPCHALLPPRAVRCRLPACLLRMPPAFLSVGNPLAAPQT